MSMRLNLTRSPSASSICLWPGHLQSLCTLSAANMDHTSWAICGWWLQTRCCELVSTRLNLLRSAFAYLCAGKKELIELGVLWTVALFGLGVGVARRRAREWGVGPPLKCDQLAAIGGASNHEWAMGDGVVVGEVVADTQVG